MMIVVCKRVIDMFEGIKIYEITDVFLNVYNWVKLLELRKKSIHMSCNIATYI